MWQCTILVESVLMLPVEMSYDSRPCGERDCRMMCTDLPVDKGTVL